jgi:hypothetical protein
MYFNSRQEFDNSFPLLSIHSDELIRNYEIEYESLKNVVITDVNFYNFTKRYGLELQINDLTLIDESNLFMYNLRIVFDLIHAENSLDLIYLSTIYNEQIISVYKTKRDNTAEFTLMVQKYVETFVKDSTGDSFIYLVYTYENMVLVVKMLSNNKYELNCKLFNYSGVNILKIVES